MVKIGEWEFPAGLLYDCHHQWIAQAGDKIRVGLTAYALEITGDVLYLALPSPGAATRAGGCCGSLEAGKWVGQIYAPVTGRVVQANQALAARPGLINQAPYDSWLFEIELRQPEEISRLMTVEQLSGWLTEEMKRDA